MEKCNKLQRCVFDHTKYNFQWCVFFIITLSPFLKTDREERRHLWSENLYCSASLILKGESDQEERDSGELLDHDGDYQPLMYVVMGSVVSWLWQAV